MRRARWLASWKDSPDRPAIYHCISRVVDRRFVFGDEEREQFRIFMRMQENFTGCRVLSYCIMSNHFHILLEVPPMPEGGISDAELLKRLGAIYSDAQVNTVAQQLEQAREIGSDAFVRDIRESYTYRMHDLSQFMKTLLQRFTRWFNRAHQRRGTLWEERFKSVIVEDGEAARTMAAYIDLNPVRAGMVQDPADYRWSSYGEAIGGAGKGNGRKAREGLVRAFLSHKGEGFDIRQWEAVSQAYRQWMGSALKLNPGRATLKRPLPTTGNASRPESQVLAPLPPTATLLRRIRYFSDGAVIGSKAFVNEVFRSARDRFGPRRRDGARRIKPDEGEALDSLWCARDLQTAG